MGKAYMNPFEISMSIKLEIIEIARKWPLYFCRLFPVVQRRFDRLTPILLGISESGIRIITKRDSQNLSIHDHFKYVY